MKKKVRFLSLAMAVTLFLTLAPGSMALSTEPLDPGMQTFSKSAQSGREIQFSAEDFVARVSDGLKLEGIVLAELPDETMGQLKCGSRDMMAGEAIIASALGSLRFVPNTAEDVSTYFSFLPVFSGEVSGQVVNVNLSLSGKENRPPVAENLEFFTYKNIGVTQPFKGSDPDGDTLVYKVIAKPKRGAVEVQAEGNFSYTPYQNKVGKDQFTYVAMDPYGNTSPEATVIIVIEKPKDKMTYADMDGHPAYYAALRLSEENVFVGEKVGKEYYFDPDQPVTRGEFVTMVMNMTGHNELSPVSKTGFADDDVTPTWVKPYASVALKEGIIKGVGKPDGSKHLCASRDITRAEAAVMLNNSLKMADTSLAVFADWEVAPVWAQQAAINMQAVGVMNTYQDGTMRLEETITRGQAAQLLLSAMDVKEKSEPKKGLLSWVFG